jgi:hypothetical protein
MGVPGGAAGGELVLEPPWFPWSWIKWAMSQLQLTIA